ncbi:MAG TPA: hypothetical protein VF589_01105 [Allosphingosinicella sp.]|jgi:hypothetical protein
MAVIKGDSGDNVLIGTRESDSLSGFGGDDRLYGLRGNDDLDGGEGADLMVGRFGDDTDGLTISAMWCASSATRDWPTSYFLR